MLVATDYIIKEKADTDGQTYYILNKSIPLCPVCNGILTGYDTRKRHIIIGSGEIQYFLLRRLYCSKCKKIHIEIPDIICPHRYYEANHIKGVVQGTVNYCPADDSTIRRWRKNYPPDLPVEKNDNDVSLKRQEVKEE